MCTEKPLPIVSMELDNLPRTDGCLGECHCLPHTGEQCQDWGSGGLQWGCRCHWEMIPLSPTFTLATLQPLCLQTAVMSSGLCWN